LQDATPLTLGQQFSGYASEVAESLVHLKEALQGVYSLALGGTAVGTGINTLAGFDRLVAHEMAQLTGLPFVTAKNKFAAQGAHTALVHMSGALRTLSTTLYKLGNDIRLLSCGPRAGIGELILPSNEPGSSIMPGKVNPTQCEALTMIALQVMSNDITIGLASAGGDLELNVYKPLLIMNLMQSIRLLTDGCTHFYKFLLKGLRPDRKRIQQHLDNAVMLVTALTPLIGYDKSAQIAHHAIEKNLSLKQAALDLEYVSEEEFNRLIQPLKMCFPSKKRAAG
jgi:fumarate hydratase class II